MLDELKSAVPDAKIYVNSITKVNAKALETEPLYAMNQDYNDVLKELCEEEKVHLLMCPIWCQKTYMSRMEFIFFQIITNYGRSV